MWYVEVILLGLVVGVLVGLMGIGGGVVLVPAMVYLLHMDQHVAQGTSLFLQLPPLGLAALLVYWRKKQVDLPAGAICALGFLFGGFFGSKIAIRMDSRIFAAPSGFSSCWLRCCYGGNLGRASQRKKPMRSRSSQLLLILAVACVVGVCAGLFGVGGGVLLVPLLVLLLGFNQHTAPGTSLVALVPPTGLLAFINYAGAGEVRWLAGC